MGVLSSFRTQEDPLDETPNSCLQLKPSPSIPLQEEQLLLGSRDAA